MTKSGQQIKVELNKVDIGQLPGVAETLQLPLAAITTGQIELRLPDGKYSSAEGNVDLSATDVRIGDGRTKIRGLLALPTVNAGNLTLKATTNQGRIKLEKFELKGPDLEADADGRVRLRDKLALGLVEQLGLSFRFSDKYRDKDDSTRALLGRAGDPIGGVIDMDPKVKQAKQADGSYNWKVTGSFSALLFTPAQGGQKK
jgi:type II secretion system protein N